MFSGRTILCVMLLAIGTVAALKITRMRPRQQAISAEAVQGERVRQFWDAYQLASRMRAAGDLAAAVSQFERALRIKPDHEDSLYYLGNCYFELERYEDAITAYQRLIRANPVGSSRGYIQLALLHASLEPGAPRDLQAASHYFNQALQLDPDSGAMLGIGEVALLQGRWQEAQQAFEIDNADNAMGMAAPYLLGYLRWRKGDRRQAWRWFHLAVQRGEFKKPAVNWAEEGDVKADPQLRWRALARQSVFGGNWLRLRNLLHKHDLSPADMEREYKLLHGVLVITGRIVQR